MKVKCGQLRRNERNGRGKACTRNGSDSDVESRWNVRILQGKYKTEIGKQENEGRYNYRNAHGGEKCRNSMKCENYMRKIQTEIGK